MKSLIRPLLVAAIWFAAAPAVSAPDARDGLTIDRQWLVLKAEARACYLGFIELYDAAYYRTEDRPLATRCVQVDYRRDFSAEALDEATRKVFRERHGEALATRYQDALVRVGAAYRAVAQGDRYTYCVGDDGNGVLWRDGRAVIRFASNEFSERFMQIWVSAETVDAQPRWAFPNC